MLNIDINYLVQKCQAAEHRSFSQSGLKCFMMLFFGNRGALIVTTRKWCLVSGMSQSLLFIKEELHIFHSFFLLTDSSDSRYLTRLLFYDILLLKKIYFKKHLILNMR